MPETAAAHPESRVDWELCRPTRRYYLWFAQSEDPLQVKIVAPEKIVELNETASYIWCQLDGSRLVNHIIEELVELNPGVDRRQVESDVLRLLVKWDRDGMINMHWEKLR